MWVKWCISWWCDWVEMMHSERGRLVDSPRRRRWDEVNDILILKARMYIRRWHQTSSHSDLSTSRPIGNLWCIMHSSARVSWIHFILMLSFLFFTTDKIYVPQRKTYRRSCRVYHFAREHSLLHPLLSASTFVCISLFLLTSFTHFSWNKNV